MLSRADLFMLTEARHHPQAAVIERASARIAESTGLATDRRFAAFNTLVSHVYPTAPVERAVTAAIWCNWLFYFDDTWDEAAPAEGDLDALQAHIRATLGVLRGERGAGHDPLLRYAALFRRRAMAHRSEGWMRRFCQSAEDYLIFGTMPAFRHHADRSTPDLQAYLDQRERDSAVHTALDLIELAQDQELPEAVLVDPDLAALRRATVRTVAVLNDVFSYPKEVLVHHNPNNAVYVLQVHEGLDEQEAIVRTVGLANELAREVAVLSQRLCARHRCGALDAWLEGVRVWQRGHIESSLVEARYRSADSPFAELRPLSRAA